jgi:hypothetical protein
LVSRLAHHAAGPFREQYDEHGTRVYTATGGQWAVEQQRLADAEEEHLLGLDFAWDKAQLGQVGNQNMYPVYVRDVQCPVSTPSLESRIESHASYSMGLAATSLQPHHPHIATFGATQDLVTLAFLPIDRHERGGSNACHKGWGEEGRGGGKSGSARLGVGARGSDMALRISHALDRLPPGGGLLHYISPCTHRLVPTALYPPPCTHPLTHHLHTGLTS